MAFIAQTLKSMGTGQSSAAARPYPLKTQKKMAFFHGLKLQHRGRRGTLNIATSALKKEGNGNRSLLEDVRTLCREGRLEEALHTLHVMDQFIDSTTYVCLLQVCIKKNALSEGKLVHAHMNDREFMPDRFLWNTLVNMYAKCGSLVDARAVFDEMPERDVFSWTVMIAAYARHGFNEEALMLFYHMQRTGIQPNQFTFACVLPACTNLTALEQGMEIHEEIIRSGFQSDVFVANALLGMYAKCGSIEYALHVFDKIPLRDVVLWTTMIAGYAQNGHVDEALKLFQAMPRQDVASWNAMIAGFRQNGYDEKALNLFKQMQLAGVKPDSKTFASVLPACANLAALEQGVEIHEEIVMSGNQSNVFVENALVDMYAKCGSIEKARHLFDKMHQRDTVSWTAMIAGYAQNGYVDEALNLFNNMPQTDVFSWNAMIAGYAQNGQWENALKLFQNMRMAGTKPDTKTFASVLPACANFAALEQGMEVHEEIVRRGFGSDLFVANALVDMYAKCGSAEKARDLFDKMHQRDAVSWTAIISGYAQNGHVEEAMHLFQKMPERDVVSWNVMIAGYAQNGHSDKSLKLFRQMQLAGVKPNAKTFATVISACANLAALEQGTEIHEEIGRSGFLSDVFVASALVDMYAKCGNVEKARDLFNKLPEQDVVSWTAMIAGYAMHGCGKEALELFEQMQLSGTNPNSVTFVCVLSACCHSGLVDEGQQYFDCMSECYHITPAMEHYSCMVDLLGRAGQLDEAHHFINKMPIEPDATVWRCLLGACRLHNNIELGEQAAECLIELEPNSAAPYVLLSNIYAAADRWDDIEKVRKMMKDRRVKKTPGCSWIEVDKEMHTFVVGDRSHPQTHNLCNVGEIM